MSIVKIDGLTKKYGKYTALNNISISIEEGIIFGLLGPNGSGKSTLINILSGSLSFNKGKCTILGQDIIRDSKYIKSRIGIVPQQYAFYEDLKVRENLEFFGRLYGLSKMEIKNNISKISESVGLTSYENEYPGKFSGGMKRRVNIACALIHNPKLLIMDEPTASLDILGREDILNTVKDINKSGCTVIYTTHNMEEVEAICSRVAILNNGEVMGEGTVGDIRNIVLGKKIIEIVINKLSQNQRRSIGESIKNKIFFDKVTIEEKSKKEDLIRFESDNITITLERVIPILKNNKIIIEDININKTSLEESFLRLTI